MSQLIFGFVERVENQHALACCKTVGLEHIRGFLLLEKFESLGNVGFCHLEVFGCGYVVAQHELFCKFLAAFEHCALFFGAYNLDFSQLLRRLEVVGNSVHKRVFVAHHKHVDVVV